MRWLACFSAVATLALSACGGGGGSAERVVPPSSTLYAVSQYSSASLVRSTNVVYSTRPNAGGVQYTSDLNKASERGTETLSLSMDVAVPPNASATNLQPLIVYIHGGGFFQGAKEDVAEKAVTYAAAGYVVAAVNYRLTPDNEATPEKRVLAIQQASEDVMNAIRFLKVNAATYHIDTSRIATLGISAGGALSLINAVQFDEVMDSVSDYPGVSSRVNAAISTGATLIEAGYDSLDLLRFDASDTPVMLLHANPTDSATGATWTGNVLPTQAAINGSGNTCTLVAQPNLSHAVSLGVGDNYWPTLQPFLFEKLNLLVLQQAQVP